MRPRITLARARKAYAIARYLQREARSRSGFDPSRRLHWDLLISRLGWTGPAEWRGLAAAAGQRYPSVRTQLVVLDLLRDWRDVSTLPERSGENTSANGHLSVSFNGPFHSARQ